MLQVHAGSAVLYAIFYFCHIACEIKEKEEVSLSDCSPSGRDNNAEALECTDVDTANNKEETVASTAPAICRQFSNDSNAPLMDN